MREFHIKAWISKKLNSWPRRKDKIRWNHSNEIIETAAFLYRGIFNKCWFTCFYWKTDNMGTFETAEKIRGTFGVSTYSLRKWAEEGKIGCVRMPGGKRLYRHQDITNLFRMPERARQNICYTRVSSNKQRADLDRQVEQMKREYPSHIVISDIGSGLNWRRPGLLHLLDLVCK